MSANHQNEMGNFRTPIAAAMLSGVLSGLAAIVLPRFIASLYKANNIELAQLIPFVVGIGLSVAMLSSSSIAPSSARGLRLIVRIGIAVGIFLAAKYVGFYGSFSMLFGVV